MVLTYEDFVRSMNEQGLSILTSWQQGAIEAYAGWMKAVAPLMPDLNLYHELPTFLQDALGEDMHRTFTAIMAAEYARVMRTVSEVDFDLYLHTV